MRLLKRFPRPDLVRFLMEESELEREVELLEGSVEGRLMSEKGVPERYVQGSANPQTPGSEKMR